jgi:pantetheine-phosphate adenylyltransferase
MSYKERVRQLEEYLRRTFPGKRFTIAELNDYFGPGIATADVQAIVVSSETRSRVPLANELRAKRGFPPLEVVVVDYVLAEDGKPISSTRIRKGEIDVSGKLRHGSVQRGFNLKV